MKKIILLALIATSLALVSCADRTKACITESSAPGIHYIQAKGRNAPDVAWQQARGWMAEHDDLRMGYAIQHVFGKKSAVVVIAHDEPARAVAVN